MDYSLLLGIHNLEKETNSSALKDYESLTEKYINISAKTDSVTRTVSFSVQNADSTKKRPGSDAKKSKYITNM